MQGYMRDVTYTLDIPVVVKQEKVEEDDDDLLDSRGNTGHQEHC